MKMIEKIKKRFFGDEKSEGKEQVQLIDRSSDSCIIWIN